MQPRLPRFLQDTFNWLRPPLGNAVVVLFGNAGTILCMLQDAIGCHDRVEPARAVAADVHPLP